MGIPRTGFTADPLEVAEMERVWADFYKLVWGPLEKAEDDIHPQMCCVGSDKEHACSMMSCHHARDPRITSQSEKMQKWDEFMLRHYRPPQIGGTIEASLKFA